MNKCSEAMQTRLLWIEGHKKSYEIQPRIHSFFYQIIFYSTYVIRVAHQTTKYRLPLNKEILKNMF